VPEPADASLCALGDRSVSVAQGTALLSITLHMNAIGYAPGEGILSVEPLARIGSTDESQICGDISLEYGPEVARQAHRPTFHGRNWSW
jgi:hypothetical protein